MIYTLAFCNDSEWALASSTSDLANCFSFSNLFIIIIIIERLIKEIGKRDFTWL